MAKLTFILSSNGNYMYSEFGDFTLKLIAEVTGVGHVQEGYWLCICETGKKVQYIVEGQSGATGEPKVSLHVRGTEIDDYSNGPVLEWPKQVHICRAEVPRFGYRSIWGKLRCIHCSNCIYCLENDGKFFRGV